MVRGIVVKREWSEGVVRGSGQTEWSESMDRRSGQREWSEGVDRGSGQLRLNNLGQQNIPSCEDSSGSTS